MRRSRRFLERQLPTFRNNQPDRQSARLELAQRERDMSMKFGLVMACVVTSLLASPALAGGENGVAATEIKIGGAFPLRGPAAAIGPPRQGLVGLVQSTKDP